jgi:flavin reductase (DIM6/NTAB) family NADH-FMN oxidoreductase RutF
MSVVRPIRKAIKKVLFGDTCVPQEFFLGMADPQTEISLWLHGMAKPLDVTLRHSMACAAPFAICIAFEENEIASKRDLQHLSLKFCECNARQQLLGEIGLKLTAAFIVAGRELALFEARSSANYCLPRPRLWAHDLLQAYSQRRQANVSDMQMSLLERRAAMVMFIRPHPVSLGSVLGASGGNIFPMNIMGELGAGYLGFALKDSRTAAHLIERSGRFALSSVPLEHAALVYRLAINHTKQYIDWSELPFATRPSSTFAIPIPVFTQRARELEVAKVHRIGSHTFFVAKIVSEETYSSDLGLSVIHGYYQAWRLKGEREKLQASIVNDLAYKKGV